MLSCEDITLKANWKKEETKKDENKPYQKTNTSSNANTNVTSSQPEKQKSYKCPSGYELTEENKC